MSDTGTTYRDLLKTRGSLESYEVTQVTEYGPVAAIGMNDPETLNAFTPRMTGELCKALGEAEEDPEIRAVVLTGSGKAFTAGGDLRMMGAGDLGPIEQFEFVRREFGGVVEMIAGMDTPVIAAVNGYAMGVGMFTALACDMVVAARSARFGTAYIQLGLVPLGVGYLLAKTIGYHRAFELCALAEQLTAEDAWRLGLVNRVVDDGDLEKTALDLARRLADGPPRALGLAKQILRHAAQADLDEHLARGEAIQPLCLNTDDHKEAVAAFAEKRKPRFRGT